MISLKKQNKGFTIVELLIVIVVIGILALLVITTYAGIQAKARNTKRQTDLKSLQTKLEAFYNDNGYYPNLADMQSDTWLAANMKGIDLNSLVDPSNPTQSNDPVATPAAKVYAYAPLDASGNSCAGAGNDVNCAKYTLTATFEGTVNGQTTYTISSLN
jgi:prepilin-type N-terminal cleavage/methylation domain-containing protein